MAATVQIVQLSGVAVAGGVSGTTTAPATSFENKNSGTLRFQTVDTLDETSFANAIPVPTGGAGTQNYSMRAVLVMFVQSGTFAQIISPRWYSLTGTNPFGPNRKLWYKMSTTYVQPATVPPPGTDPPQFQAADMLDWFATDSGAPATPPAGGSPGPFDNTFSGKYIGDFLNLVFEVEFGSNQGTTPAETIVLAWDEI